MIKFFKTIGKALGLVKEQPVVATQAEEQFVACDNGCNCGTTEEPVSLSSNQPVVKVADEYNVTASELVEAVKVSKEYKSVIQNQGKASTGKAKVVSNGKVENVSVTAEGSKPAKKNKPKKKSGNSSKKVDKQ